MISAEGAVGTSISSHSCQACAYGMQLPDSALSKTVQIHVAHKIIEPLERYHAALAWLLVKALSASHNCTALQL